MLQFVDTLAARLPPIWGSPPPSPKLARHICPKLIKQSLRFQQKNYAQFDGFHGITHATPN
jgi:hypothetical protein